MAGVRPLQGRSGFSIRIRKLHLRLLTVSRFAGLLRSLDPAYPLRKDGDRYKGGKVNGCATRKFGFGIVP